MAEAPQNPFVNRIVGYGVKRASEFIKNPLNHRRHPQVQRDAMRASLGTLGWIAAVIENQRTGRLIDGHERIDQALDGDQEVPYLIVDLDEDEEMLALATFDYITYLAQTDKDAYAALMARVTTTDATLRDVLDRQAKSVGLLLDKPDTDKDADAKMDAAAELREIWQVAPGQLWHLGPHRLLCGDAGIRTDMERLMGDDRFACVWTDPPYGVNYVGKTKDALTIQNDAFENLDALGAFLFQTFKLAASFAVPSAPFYMTAPPGPNLFAFGDALRQAQWRVQQILTWVKDSMVLGHSDYHYRHEAILYGYLPGPNFPGRGRSPSFWYGDNAQTSIFEVDRPKASEHHPTMKPVDLVTAMLRNSTRPGDIVFEPFSGSGTTLLACEQLNRQCRAMEVDARFVAVALQRYADATGDRPVLAQHFQPSPAAAPRPDTDLSGDLRVPMGVLVPGPERLH
jgi:site-specific DNA-methyltransferase (adenine-specific)